MSLLCKLVPERLAIRGLCQIEAPDIFDYDEEGIVLFAQEPEAHQQFVMPEEETYVKKAVCHIIPIRKLKIISHSPHSDVVITAFCSLNLKISRDLFLLFREIPTYFERFICYL
ncbi:hypothetical protein EfmAA610_11500 [Enterococcus faecium]|nr:hypothetical protein EfmAA610_11500 [Enterococcus faecium]